MWGLKCNFLFLINARGLICNLKYYSNRLQRNITFVTQQFLETQHFPCNLLSTRPCCESIIMKNSEKSKQWYEGRTSPPTPRIRPGYVSYTDTRRTRVRQGWEVSSSFFKIFEFWTRPGMSWTLQGRNHNFFERKSWFCKNKLRAECLDTPAVKKS